MSAEQRVQDRKNMERDTLIKEVSIPIEMIDIARKKADEMGTLRNSITKGDGNIFGFLGELIVAKYLGIKVDNTYDFDMKLHNGKKIDVKTKATSVKPKLNYECSIAAYNIKQVCDFYVFSRVHKNMNTGWVLGYMPKKAYLDTATQLKKGDYDPSNNFTVKADCYNLEIEKLYDIDYLKVLDTTD